MRVLFDITDPAFVHFFKCLIRLLKERGDEVLVCARDTDITIQLLDAFDIPYVCISRRKKGLLGMFWELLQRDANMLKVARRFRPHVLMAASGVSIGIVGTLLHIPSMVLEEAEHAWVQQVIGLPFVTRIFTGTGYLKQLGAREVCYQGVWVQAYLSPRYFQPNPEPLRRAGVDPDQPYIVLRTLSWSAIHDIGLQGTSEQEVLRIAERLSRFGRVLITSEKPLPAFLEQFRNPVPVEYMHDLLAFASLYIGEGGTMAAEAAVLGTPAIFCNPLRTGYLLALEKQYGLVYNINSLIDGLQIAERLLTQGDAKQLWAKRRRKLLAESEDITEFMFRLIESAARRGG